MQRKRRLVFLVPVAIVVGLVASVGLIMHRGQLDIDLIKAIKADDTRAALAALDSGADPNIRDHREAFNFWSVLRGRVAHDFTDDYYATPLQIALNAEITYGMSGPPGVPNRIHAENPALIKALLEHGADPNATAMKGTPLMRAAEYGFSNAVKMLLEKGVDVDRQDSGGTTALFFAARGRNPEAVRLLLDHGADPDRKDIKGLTPREGAKLSFSKEVQVLLRQAKRKG